MPYVDACAPLPAFLFTPIAAQVVLPPSLHALLAVTRYVVRCRSFESLRMSACHVDPAHASPIRRLNSDTTGTARRLLLEVTAAAWAPLGVRGEGARQDRMTLDDMCLFILLLCMLSAPAPLPVPFRQCRLPYVL